MWRLKYYSWWGRLVNSRSYFNVSWAGRGIKRLNAGSAAVLGLIQGLTEFLPVSSSGHLVLFQHLLGVQQSGLLFEVMVHFGTVVAVVFAFWSDIVTLIRRPWHKLTLLIVVGMIPTGLMGVLLEPVFQSAFDSVAVVGVALLVTGVLLWIASKWSSGRKDLSRMSIWDALVIGFGQGLAITPGLSRSGTTVAFALFSGLEPAIAAKYSFLLSVPVIIAANLWEARDLLFQPIQWGAVGPNLLAALLAAISGYVAIKFFLGILKSGHLHYFSYYCWTVGALVLIYVALI